MRPYGLPESTTSLEWGKMPDLADLGRLLAPGFATSMAGQMVGAPGHD